MECCCIRQKLLIWLHFALFFSFIYVNGQETKKFPLLMPHVVPEHVDSYLCTSIRLDQTEDYYITAFEPNSTMDVAHHMFVMGCSEPVSPDEVWNCGDMTGRDKEAQEGPQCKNNSQLIYAWARDAPTLTLPDEVGFKVGGNSDIQYIILQVHYFSVDRFKDGFTDDSGVFLYYTKSPMPKLAGVLLLGTDGRILPNSVEYLESVCTINENIVIHPFAFRTHTHSLGRVVSGYKIAEVDGKPVWTLIGKKDPQLPQMFYSIPYDITVSKGEMLASRCTIENNQDRIVHVGNRVKDEMCSFFIMYWKDSSKYANVNVRRYCYTPPSFHWSDLKLKNIPTDASSLPVDEMTNEIM